jgi:hypothetical protein
VEHVSEHPAAVVELDASLADAVVGALRRRGCPAWTAEGDDGRVVLVPGSRREQALRLVADAMDELATSAIDRRPPPTEPSEDDDEPSRRMVLPRLRDAGIAILLVPLLIVTLSAISIPRDWAATVFIAGIVVIVALRARARRDDA